jgi:uncharacterized protein
MRRRPLVATAVLLLAGAGPAAARADMPAGGAPEPVVIAQSYTMRSEILDETRRYNVMLPPGYAGDQARYPVLLLLDGGIAEDFHHLSGIVQVSVGNGTMRPVIVVGLENTERRRDTTGPTEVAEDRRIAPRVGGSAAFRRFLAEELLPKLRADYRTQAPTAIVGESLAGLFVVETLLLQPGLFDIYVAVSPSLWWNGDYLVREAGPLLANKELQGKVVFLTVADEKEMQPQVAALARQLRGPGEQRVRLHYHPMPDETHASIFHGAALKAFRLVLAPPATATAGQ